MREIARLAAAIRYPVRVPDGALSFTFSVDDDPIEARIVGGRLRLSWAFPQDAPASVLAGFATGRMLREEAVVAWDPAGGRAILWQRAQSGADDRSLVGMLQDFVNSRDWWKARVSELVAPKATLADLVIRP